MSARRARHDASIEAIDSGETLRGRGADGRRRRPRRLPGARAVRCSRGGGRTRPAGRGRRERLRRRGRDRRHGAAAGRAPPRCATAGFRLPADRPPHRGRRPLGDARGRRPGAGRGDRRRRARGVGRDALVNAGAIVGHDVRLGECVHVASGARVGRRRHGRATAPTSARARSSSSSARSATAPSSAPAPWCSRTSPAGERVGGIPARLLGPRGSSRVSARGRRPPAPLARGAAVGALRAARVAAPAPRRRGLGAATSTASRSGRSIPADHDPVRRAALLASDGLDVAVVALSSPLGIEALPADEAAALLDAYHRGRGGAARRPARLGRGRARGARSARASARALDAGLVGLCLPAGALVRTRAGPSVRPAPRAARAARSAALFVHPGPAPWAPARPTRAGRPAWWPALTVYVAQMHVAWLGVREWVRPAFPRPARVLRDARRPRARSRPSGWPRAAAAPTRATRSPSTTPRPTARAPSPPWRPRSGPDALVHGSDRPVVAPARRPRGTTHPDPTRSANPARLLALQEVRT